MYKLAQRKRFVGKGLQKTDRIRLFKRMLFLTKF